MSLLAIRRVTRQSATAHALSAAGGILRGPRSAGHRAAGRDRQSSARHFRAERIRAEIAAREDSGHTAAVGTPKDIRLPRAAGISCRGNAA